MSIYTRNTVTPEWTADAFAPYPGFVAGPYRDYSARWFGNHERLHDPRFRNSFLPQRTNIFAGFRTAATYN